ncbi:hypothetical protein H2201_007930 [Coniosporium apollinis]|uniref:RING-type domain-containing protein n=1 Tax=Coniosporium apollinis TaxID=61459 RepID=A0ABQ9NI20_9PEZI|nr:hypothetical protein H2201_007930 [Coniosporium apollinis]
MAALPSRTDFLTNGITPVDINNLPQDKRDCDICTENFHMQSDQGGMGYRPVSINCPARHVYCFGCITEWFNFVTDEGEYNNTCPTCRAELYEPEDASGSEQDEEPPLSPDQSMPGFTDITRARLARYHGPTNASDELINTAGEWLPYLWSRYRRPTLMWFLTEDEDEDVEGEMFTLIEQELRRPGRRMLPTHELYDRLLAAALEQRTVREYGAGACLGVFIEAVVKYLWEGGEGLA